MISCHSKKLPSLVTLSNHKQTFGRGSQAFSLKSLIKAALFYLGIAQGMEGERRSLIILILGILIFFLERNKGDVMLKKKMN